ncbi:MAG: VCBS repeat-containing protein [Planctomycetes bacterium]|nr:VCBS repeat-containing protein [Planctomycetota bacterium]
MNATRYFTVVSFLTLLLVLPVLLLLLSPTDSAAEDWPLFNFDEKNSCFTTQKGDVDLNHPKLKWQRDILGIWTGFTFSHSGGSNLLTFLPSYADQVVVLNTDTGGTSYSYKGYRAAGRDQIGPYGTGEGIPLHYDINWDGVAEIFSPIDSFGVVAWDGASRTPIWSVHLPSEHSGGRGSLNAVLGDVNADGKKELVVMQAGPALRSIRCYDASTGSELWVFNGRDVSGGDWLQGEITQNFPVWSDVDGDGKPELFFQHQVNVGPDRAVDVFCIKTEPTLKAFSYLNNPPSTYSFTPVRPWSGVSSGGDPTVGEYELLFTSSNTVSVNGGPDISIVTGDPNPNTNVIPGLTLYFGPVTALGDRATVWVHNSPARVWKKTFASGFCFAHFLLSDFNNDGEQEIAFGTTGKYYLIDKNGNILWQYDTGIAPNDFEDIVWGGAFADIDSDGIKEIVFVAFDKLICLKGDTGQAKWTFQVPMGDISKFPDGPGFTNFLRAYPLIADIGGSQSGGLEIVTTDAEHVYAVDKDGNAVMSYRYATYDPAKGRPVTPDGDFVSYPYTSKRFIFADIDGDGEGELVGSYALGTEGVNHRAFCLE